MDKKEAKKRIRLQVLRMIEKELEFVILFANDDINDRVAEEALRDALAKEIQHLAKRAYGFVKDSYGRNRCVAERVYETRIDCNPEPGGARHIPIAA